MKIKPFPRFLQRLNSKLWERVLSQSEDSEDLGLLILSIEGDIRGRELKDQLLIYVAEL